jgi:hypothetical protein
MSSDWPQVVMCIRDCNKELCIVMTISGAIVAGTLAIETAS